ncbi:MAG TPA: BTAD domain-containing putative transcriptional regulator, partial [Acidimicrobiia bacterium]|nr:BTAD domain-containing putative transcriptional regulator [Acidimicrobiia bacterium]
MVTVELAWEAEVEAEAVAAGAAGRGGPPPFVGLRLLGPLQVVYGDAAPGGPPGGWIIDIGSAKQRAVLAVLGLHLNEVVSRDLLVDRLWGDRPPTSATVTLRSLVSRLRKALDGAAVGLEIVTREPGWTLRGEANAVDAAQFTALTAEARLLLAGGEPAAAALCWRKALGLWRGAALGDVVDAGYLAAEATRLDEARLDAVEDLADAELASGWAADALARLEPHIAGHPLRERSWGELMLALYHLGRQAEAVRAYQRLRAVLREELGLDPTPALADLEARILRHDPALGPPPAAARVESAAAAPPTPAAGLTAATAATPAPFSAGSPERTPFVGRVAELAVLSTALERARAGSGGMMLIGGEPGIGKTRLAEEAAAEAVAAGMGVLVGHSYEIAGAAPYVAVVEILEAALAAAPSAEAFVADVLGDAAPEVARLLPRVRRRFPDLPAPLELPPAQERLYLFRCLTDILARLAGACPTLVVLDDLQWADDATLLFVEHLAPQLAGLPLLVVATYRDTDVGRPLARTFGELHRRRLAGRISLAALTPVEAGELVAGLAGQDPPAELVDALHAASDGNVFFLEEIVRDLAESGRAFDDTGRFRTGVDVGDLGLPEGVRLVIERRLDRLSEPARAALAAAAVSGRVFSVALLQALIALDGDEVLDIVDEAEQAVLIAASGNDDEFLFAHELIRQTLVAGLSGTRRRRLHARSAEALERVHGHDVWAVAATIAHHLLEAGPAADPKRTFHYLKTAAESAMETSAFEEAVRHFESALLLPDAATARALTDLRVGLGRAHRSIGNSDIAIGHWRDAIDSYAALGDVEDAAELCAELAWHLCWAARWPEAKEVTDRGLAALGDRQGPARVALLISSAFACVIGEQYEAAEQRVDTAVEEAESLGDPHVVGRAQWAKATADWCVTRYNEAAQRGLRAAALQKEIGAVWDRTQTLLYVQLALHPLGRWDEAASTDDEVGPLAARLGHHLALCLGRRERAARERNSRPDFAHYREFARADLELNRETSLGWVGQSYAF